MTRRSYFVVAGAAVAIAWYLYSSSGTRRFDAPITIAEGTIVVRNDSDREWRNVVVTVNHHFHGGARTLAPGGRLSAPLSQLVTAHGQRYNRARQSVFKVEVTATDSTGEPVRLDWDREGAKRP